MRSRRGPGRPAEADRPDRAQQITRAAIELFAMRGYAATSFASIAEHAGLTPPALYHYHDDKSALFVHTVRVARREVWDMVCAALEHRDSLVEDFAELARVIQASRSDLLFRHATRLLATVQVAASHHDELADLRTERWLVRDEIIGEIGRRAFDRGELPTFVDVQQAARAIEVIFAGWATEVYASPDHREELTDAALAAVRAISSGPEIRAQRNGDSQKGSR